MKPFRFVVTVEVERESGKFMSRDDVEQEILAALEDADIGSISGGPDGDSIYSTIVWEVEAHVRKPTKT